MTEIITELTVIKMTNDMTSELKVSWARQMNVQRVKKPS